VLGSGFFFFGQKVSLVTARARHPFSPLLGGRRPPPILPVFPPLERRTLSGPLLFHWSYPTLVFFFRVVFTQSLELTAVCVSLFPPRRRRRATDFPHFGPPPKLEPPPTFFFFCLKAKRFFTRPSSHPTAPDHFSMDIHSTPPVEKEDLHACAGQRPEPFFSKG